MTGRLNKTIYQIEDQKNKVDILWINLLDGKNLVSPILEKYRIIDNYAEFINRTVAIRNEIDLIDLNETEQKRIITDRVTNFDSFLDSFSIKLHPIDDNLKRVRPFSLLK